MCQELRCCCPLDSWQDSLRRGTEELTHHAVHTSELMVAVALEANTSAEEGPKSSKIQTLDPEFTS